jgi:hypothetical protein
MTSIWLATSSVKALKGIELGMLNDNVKDPEVRFST